MTEHGGKGRHSIRDTQDPHWNHSTKDSRNQEHLSIKDSLRRASVHTCTLGCASEHVSSPSKTPLEARTQEWCASKHVPSPSTTPLEARTQELPRCKSQGKVHSICMTMWTLGKHTHSKNQKLDWHSSCKIYNYATIYCFNKPLKVIPTLA